MGWQLVLCLGLSLALTASAGAASVSGLSLRNGTHEAKPPNDLKNLNSLIPNPPMNLIDFGLNTIPKEREIIEESNVNTEDEDREQKTSQENGTESDNTSKESENSEETERDDSHGHENQGSYESRNVQGTSEDQSENTDNIGDIPVGVRSEETEEKDSERTSKEEDGEIESNESLSENVSPDDGKNSPEVDELSQEEDRASPEEDQASPEGDRDSPEDDLESPEDGGDSLEIPDKSGSEQEVEDLPCYVELTDGSPVQGYLLHEERDICSYLDIPYGHFSKLFDAPEKHPPWLGSIHEVKSHKSRCPQLGDENTLGGDFDCLTLSVLAPKNGKNLPVIFNIYESEWLSGSADYRIYGPEHFSQDAIVVLPNYRLGVLGFLCLLNELAPGNAALKDLALALEWTHENIWKFGGDNSSITVSGLGLSAALAGYLALSTKTRHLINAVILESGSPLAHWAIDRDPLTTASVIKDIQDYRNITYAVELLKTTRLTKFSPCVENGTDPFLNATPWEILQSEQNLGIPFMIGAANNAGMQKAVQAVPYALQVFNNNFSAILPDDLSFGFDDDRDEIAGRVKSLYFGNKTISENEIQNVSLYYTDSFYLGAAIRFSRALLEAGSKVYFYEFSFSGSFNRERLSLDIALEGAARGDLIGYTFAQGGQMPAVGSPEESMLKLVTSLWLSFIKTKKPASDEIQDWNELKKVEEENEEWLSIGEEVTMQRGLHLERIQMWTELYKNYFIERNLAVGPNSDVLMLMFALFVVFIKIFNT